MFNSPAIIRRALLRALLALSICVLASGCNDSDFHAETVDNLALLGQIESPFCCRIPDQRPLMHIGGIEVDPILQLAGYPVEETLIGITVGDVSPAGVLEFHWDGLFVATGQERGATPIPDPSDPPTDTLFRTDSDVGGFDPELLPYTLHVYANSCAFTQASFLVTVFEYRYVGVHPVSGEPLIEILKVQPRTVTLVNGPDVCETPPEDVIAFTRTIDPGTPEILTGDLDGNEEELTDDAFEDLDPAWSPDGQRIAFATNRGSPLYYELYTMNADGSGVAPATAFGTRWVDDPAWAPNGHEIALTVALPGMPDTDIWIVDLDLPLGPANPRQLTTGTGYDVSPTWSPDGTEIAFVRSGSILVVPADGSAGPSTRLATVSALSVDWSSLDQLVYDRYETQFIAYRIWKVGSDGQNPVRVNDGVVGLSDTGPAWSRDGSRIAFVRGVHFAEFPERQIHVMGADGSNPQPIGNQPGDNVDPDW